MKKFLILACLLLAGCNTPYQNTLGGPNGPNKWEDDKVICYTYRGISCLPKTSLTQMTLDQLATQQGYEIERIEE